MLFQPVLILLENLDVVISEAQQSHQDSSHNHKDDVDIVKAGKQ